MINFLKKIKGSFSKFLHTKFIFIITAIIMVLCVAASLIFIRASGSFIKMRFSIENKNYGKVSINGQRPADIKGYAVSDLYVNCETSADATAYIGSGNTVLVPLDSILKTIGEKFNYYSSDDIVTTEINGKKLILKLGESSVNFGGKVIKLIAPSVSSDSHIFISSEFSYYIEGVYISSYPEKKAVYINYFPKKDMKIAESLKVLRFIEGKAGFFNISGRKTYWANYDSKNNEGILASPDDKRFLLKSSGKVYLLDISGYLRKKILYVNYKAKWSVDGNNLYWTNGNNEKLYIYDLNSYKLIGLGDLVNKISKDKEVRTENINDWELNKYAGNENFITVLFTNKSTGVNYAITENSGKVVIKGKSLLSPDGKHLISFSNNKCYVSSMYGLVHYVGKSKDAKWINNNELFLTIDGEKYLYNFDSDTKAVTKYRWALAGQNKSGDLFFTRGLTLWTEKNGTVNKEQKLPFLCDYIFSPAENSPYILASKKDNIVYFNSEKRLVEIGKYDNLISFGKDKNNFSGSFTTSPDDENYVVFQSDIEKMQFNLNVMRKNWKTPKKLTLDFYAQELSQLKDIRYRWLSNDLLLISTQKQGWIIKISDKLSVYSWTEEQNSVILGIN